MPPKKQQQGSGTKVKDDKTFGMKNKNKSAKVQKQVQIIQQQASMAGKNKEELAKQKEKERLAEEKLADAKRKKEEAELFKPVQVQKVPFGVDPKTVLCAFHKAGHCDKGNKCKFSHNLDIGRKVEKRDLYSDARDDKAEDTMDKWDDEKLKSVVLSKTGNPRTTTDIVCKYFIEAIESQKYGWFWECPDGEKCKYRHALPPGFVLRSQKKAMDDAAKANTISLEEFLEVERHKLGSNLTPVTPETFAKWKRTRMDKKQAEQEAIRKAKDTQHAAGKLTGMSGRDLFSYNPEWFADEDEEEDDGFDLARYKQHYREDGEEEQEEEQRGGLQDGSTDGEDNGDDDDEQPPDSEDGDGEEDEGPVAGPSSRPDV